MEHRWGRRVAVDIPVRLVGEPGAIGTGRLADVSITGALVHTQLQLPPLALVEVILPLQNASNDMRAARGCVVRQCAEGFGVEWCDLPPGVIETLLRMAMAENARDESDETSRASSGH